MSQHRRSRYDTVCENTDTELMIEFKEVENCHPGEVNEKMDIEELHTLRAHVERSRTVAETVITSHEITGRL